MASDSAGDPRCVLDPRRHEHCSDRVRPVLSAGDARTVPRGDPEKVGLGSDPEKVGPGSDPE